MNPSQAFANRTARLHAEATTPVYTTETPAPEVAVTDEAAQDEIDFLAVQEENYYRAEMDADYWSEVEQGRWDDDPSPYNGDYSEM